MTTNQDIIYAAKRLSDYTKDARGRESFDFDNYSLAEFAELLTQPLRQELAECRKKTLIEAAALCEKKFDAHGWNYHLPSVGREFGAELRRMAEGEK